MTRLFLGHRCAVDADQVYALGVYRDPLSYSETGAIVAWVHGRERPVCLFEPSPFAQRPDLESQEAILREIVGRVAAEWKNGTGSIVVPVDDILDAYAAKVKQQEEEWQRAKAECDAQRAAEPAETAPEPQLPSRRWCWPWARRTSP